MNIIAKTQRLILRELSVSDAEDFYKLNKNPNVIKYTGDKPFESVSEAELFLSRYSDYTLNGYGRWAVISRETSSFLGWCGLKYNEENLIDLGFRFYEDMWGNGYATESAKASINYGFNVLKIKTIIGRASLSNKASIRVLEKVGMKFWKESTCQGISKAVYYKITQQEHGKML